MLEEMNEIIEKEINDMLDKTPRLLGEENCKFNIAAWPMYAVVNSTSNLSYGSTLHGLFFS